MAYPDEFYTERKENAAYAARAVLTPFLAAASVESAIDFGCGIGSWLAVAKQLGVQTVRGVDGPWVNTALLEIDHAEFTEHDLSQPLEIDQGYDLAISLEVAEHLPPERARSFVEELCRAAGLVLFSAAVPGQGGRCHLNEQWPSFWTRLFAREGYQPIDCIRWWIWGDRDIEWWYRQNTILFVGEDELGDTARRLNSAPVTDMSLLDLVHPALLAAKLKTLDSRGRLAERFFKLWFRKACASRSE